jgi:dynactin 1
LAEAKLANAETQVEDLKLQLDDALGAEDLLEQLTERNLQMGEVSSVSPERRGYS